MTKVIKGGTIVTADREWKADVLIENEKIKPVSYTHLTLPTN